MEKAKLEDDCEPRAIRSLPVFNFLDFYKAKADILLKQALPADHQRLRVHLSKVPLGFVLVTAHPRFRKTLSATLIGFTMQASFGKMFSTAPTNVATDNFANQLDSTSRGSPTVSTRPSARNTRHGGSSLMMRWVRIQKESKRRGERMGAEATRGLKHNDSAKKITEATLL
ncbi:uncharacterized protein TrAtP1_002724 [Trichoderma atroviride]|uniref:uncharacterized protein n=1 Tax=Hypocrea atroviridis TaxID=63577 RepID=UPI0033272F4C|nr:hypothetical protein TrAtP1_002724 [Trichoderma atroviride]